MMTRVARAGLTAFVVGTTLCALGRQVQPAAESDLPRVVPTAVSGEALHRLGVARYRFGLADANLDIGLHGHRIAGGAVSPVLLFPFGRSDRLVRFFEGAPGGKHGRKSYAAAGPRLTLSQWVQGRPHRVWEAQLVKIRAGAAWPSGTLAFVLRAEDLAISPHAPKQAREEVARVVPGYACYQHESPTGPVSCWAVVGSGPAVPGDTQYPGRRSDLERNGYSTPEVERDFLEGRSHGGGPTTGAPGTTGTGVPQAPTIKKGSGR